MKSDELVEEIRKIAKSVYEELGRGFRETVYRNAIAVELEMEKGGTNCQRKKHRPVLQGIAISAAYLARDRRGLRSYGNFPSRI